jgi:hypothetical protein
VVEIAETSPANRCSEKIHILFLIVAEFLEPNFKTKKWKISVSQRRKSF